MNSPVTFGAPGRRVKQRVLRGIPLPLAQAMQCRVFKGPYV